MNGKGLTYYKKSMYQEEDDEVRRPYQWKK